MLKIKTSSKTVNEDYVAVEAATGVSAISNRHIIGIIAVCVLSIILALPYGKLLPASQSPLLSIVSQKEKMDLNRQENYLTSNDQDVENEVEIAQTAGSEENYDDMEVPSSMFTSNEDSKAEIDSTNFKSNQGFFASKKSTLNQDNASSEVLRQRFEGINDSINIIGNNKTNNAIAKNDDPQAQKLGAIDKIKNLMAEKGINPEDSLIANILGTSSKPLNVNKRPKGQWYQQTVHKGDTLSQIFNYLNLPFTTLKKIENASAKKDLRLAQGQIIQFYIDKNNIVLEMVKPLDKDNQVRFTRNSADDKFTSVYEKTNAHIETPKSVAKFADATSMPLAKEKALERQKQEELLAKEKALMQARMEQEAKLAHEQELALEKQLAQSLKTRPRLVLGMIKSKESFDKAAKRAGLTKTEIATIKNSFSGKINFKRLTVGDSFRILTDGIGTRANITAMEIVSARNGRVTLYRNPSNRMFYEEGKYRPSAGAFKRFPIAGRIKVNSPFNPRRMHPIRHKIVPHWGVDFKVSVGTPVYAPSDGKVKFAGYMRGGGYVVILNHKGGYSTVYMHLSKFDVKKGQSVSMGQVIAKSGNTGYSTGAHLHYELHVNGRAIDPLKADLPSGNTATANSLRKQFDSTVAVLKSDLYKSSLAAR